MGNNGRNGNNRGGNSPPPPPNKDDTIIREGNGNFCRKIGKFVENNRDGTVRSFGIILYILHIKEVATGGLNATNEREMEGSPLLKCFATTRRNGA